MHSHSRKLVYKPKQVTSILRDSASQRKFETKYDDGKISENNAVGSSDDRKGGTDSSRWINGDGGDGGRRVWRANPQRRGGRFSYGRSRTKDQRGKNEEVSSHGNYGPQHGQGLSQHSDSNGLFVDNFDGVHKFSNRVPSDPPRSRTISGRGTKDDGVGLVDMENASDGRSIRPEYSTKTDRPSNVLDTQEHYSIKHEHVGAPHNISTLIYQLNRIYKELFPYALSERAKTYLVQNKLVDDVRFLQGKDYHSHPVSATARRALEYFAYSGFDNGPILDIGGSLRRAIKYTPNIVHVCTTQCCTSDMQRYMDELRQFYAKPFLKGVHGLNTMCDCNPLSMSYQNIYGNTPNGRFCNHFNPRLYKNVLISHPFHFVEVDSLVHIFNLLQQNENIDVYVITTRYENAFAHLFDGEISYEHKGDHILVTPQNQTPYNNKVHSQFWCGGVHLFNISISWKFIRGSNHYGLYKIYFHKKLLTVHFTQPVTPMSLVAGENLYTELKLDKDNKLHLNTFHILNRNLPTMRVHAWGKYRIVVDMLESSVVYVPLALVEEVSKRVIFRARKPDDLAQVAGFLKNEILKYHLPHNMETLSIIYAAVFGVVKHVDQELSALYGVIKPLLPLLAEHTDATKFVFRSVFGFENIVAFISASIISLGYGVDAIQNKDVNYVEHVKWIILIFLVCFILAPLTKMCIYKGKDKNWAFLFEECFRSYKSAKFHDNTSSAISNFNASGISAPTDGILPLGTTSVKAKILPDVGATDLTVGQTASISLAPYNYQQNKDMPNKAFQEEKYSLIAAGPVTTDMIPVVPATSVKNLEAAMAKRVLKEPKPVNDKFACAYLAFVGNRTKCYFEYNLKATAVMREDLFNEWVSRYPLARQETLKKVWAEYKRNPQDALKRHFHKREVFEKREALPYSDENGLFEGKAARVVSANLSDMKHVVQGPFVFFFSKHLKEKNGKDNLTRISQEDWDLWKFDRSCFFYAPGMTSQDLGKWFDIVTPKFNFMIGNDYSSYDQSERIDIRFGTQLMLSALEANGSFITSIMPGTNFYEYPSVGLKKIYDVSKETDAYEKQAFKRFCDSVDRQWSNITLHSRGMEIVSASIENCAIPSIANRGVEQQPFKWFSIIAEKLRLPVSDRASSYAVMIKRGILINENPQLSAVDYYGGKWSFDVQVTSGEDGTSLFNGINNFNLSIFACEYAAAMCMYEETVNKRAANYDRWHNDPRMDQMAVTHIPVYHVPNNTPDTKFSQDYESSLSRKQMNKTMTRTLQDFINGDSELVSTSAPSTQFNEDEINVLQMVDHGVLGRNEEGKVGYYYKSSFFDDENKIDSKQMSDMDSKSAIAVQNIDARVKKRTFDPYLAAPRNTSPQILEDAALSDLTVAVPDVYSTSSRRGIEFTGIFSGDDSAIAIKMRWDEEKFTSHFKYAMDKLGMTIKPKFFKREEFYNIDFCSGHFLTFKKDDVERISVLVPLAGKFLHKFGYVMTNQVNEHTDQDRHRAEEILYLTCQTRLHDAGQVPILGPLINKVMGLLRNKLKPGKKNKNISKAALQDKEYLRMIHHYPHATGSEKFFRDHFTDAEFARYYDITVDDIQTVESLINSMDKLASCWGHPIITKLIKKDVGRDGD